MDSMFIYRGGKNTLIYISYIEDAMAMIIAATTTTILTAKARQPTTNTESMICG